jgi:hypothetical protein
VSAQWLLKYEFAYDQFMDRLEPTVEDLTKAFVTLAAEEKELSFARVQKLLEPELRVYPETHFFVYPAWGNSSFRIDA